MKQASRKVGMARLLKLATFLTQLPPQKFDFGQIAYENEKPMLQALKARKERCGTVACAIGWSPAVFPRLVKWAKLYNGDHALCVVERTSTDTLGDSFSTAERLFALTFDESRYLFAPYRQREVDGNAKNLTDSATAKEVARHIRRFVRRGGLPNA